MQELELTLPPFLLVPTSEHTLVPMVTMPKHKVQNAAFADDPPPDSMRMVSE